MPSIARRVHLARTTYGISPEGLSARTGGVLSPERIEAIESDAQSDATVTVLELTQLAHALKVKPHELAPALDQFYAD